MPSLPTNAFWGNPFGRYLNNQRHSRNTKSLVISMVILYAFPVFVNTLFQWIVHLEIKYDWSLQIRALIQVVVFSPFSIVFLLFILESARKYTFFTIVEVGLTWVGSFTWAATHNSSWNASYSTFILASRLAFTFVPHIWMVLLVVTILHFLKWGREEELNRISVGDLGDSSYYSRLEVGRVYWAKNEDGQIDREGKQNKTPIELPQLGLNLVQNGPAINRTSFYPSSEGGKESLGFFSGLEEQQVGPIFSKAAHSVFSKESTKRSILWTLTLNVFLYLCFFTFFVVIKEVSGTEIWSFSIDALRDKIYRIYWALLIICVIGKFVSKRIARFIDRSGSADYASTEILMELMFDVFYSVVFRFLFPVFATVWTFIIIKLLHTSGDVIQNVVKISETYFVWTSWFQETWLFRYFGIAADNSTREEWITRIEVDTTIRMLISVLVGLQVLTLNLFIFPNMFGWSIRSDVEWYNISSILIEGIVYFGSIRLLPWRLPRFLNPIKVLRILNETSYEYLIFLVLCLQYVSCYVGVPKEVIKH